MNVISVPLNESLYLKVKEFSEREKIPIEQFASSAIAEQLAAFTTMDYIKDRFGNITKEDIDRVFARIPDVEPEEYDRL